MAPRRSLLPSQFAASTFCADRSENVRATPAAHITIRTGRLETPVRLAREPLADATGQPSHPLRHLTHPEGRPIGQGRALALRSSSVCRVDGVMASFRVFFPKRL